MVENQLGWSRHPWGKIVVPNLRSMFSGGSAAVGAIGGSIGQLRGAVFTGGDGGFWMDGTANGFVTLAVTALAGLMLAAAVFYTTSGRLKSPWSRRKRKHVLLPHQWRNLFTPDGKLRDNGIKLLKTVRSGVIFTLRVLIQVYGQRFGHFFLAYMTYPVPRKKDTSLEHNKEMNMRIYEDNVANILNKTKNF